MKIKPYPPIKSDNFEAMCKEWIDVILSEESGTWIWPPLNAPYRRIWQFQKDISLQEKLFKNKSKDNLIIHVDFEQIEDLNQSQIREIIKNNLLNQTYLINIKNEGLLEIIDQIVKINKKTINFFITGVDSSIKNNNWLTIDELCFLAQRNWETHILLFTETDLTSPEFLSKFNKRTTLNQNLFITPLYSREDTDAFIKYISFNWNIKLTDDQYRWIINNCGGHFLLVKEVLRLVRKKSDIKTDEIEKSESIILKTQAILQSYQQSERKILTNIANGVNLSSNLIHSKSFLLRQKVIVERGNKLEITVRFIESFIKSSNLYKNYGQNNLLIFSQLEMKVFELMKNNLNKIIDRSRISEAIWEENWEDKYSDWAIDQLMHRVREKIKKEKLPYNLQTKKGQGFVLLENK